MTDQAIPAWAVPGAKVVWISDDTAPGLISPAKGVTYTIREFDDSPGAERAVWIRLVEIVNPIGPDGYELSINLRNFRPAVEPKSEAHDVQLFETLVKDMPIIERLDRLKELLDV